MAKKMFVSASEMAESLEISRAHAYKRRTSMVPKIEDFDHNENLDTS